MAVAAGIPRPAVLPFLFAWDRNLLPSGHTRRSFLDVMPAVPLKAHYDGNRILLDEPFEIPPNSPLMVTVFPLADWPMDRDSLLIARQALTAAYSDGDDPEYSDADLSR